MTTFLYNLKIKTCEIAQAKISNFFDAFKTTEVHCVCGKYLVFRFSIFFFFLRSSLMSLTKDIHRRP